jgi:hypothetical protein
MERVREMMVAFVTILLGLAVYLLAACFVGLSLRQIS